MVTSDPFSTPVKQMRTMDSTDQLSSIDESNKNRLLKSKSSEDDDDSAIQYGSGGTPSRHNSGGGVASSNRTRNYFPTTLRWGKSMEGDDALDATNHTAQPEYQLPRLVLRNRAFHQSSNKVHIQHNQPRVKIYKLLRFNWFFVFLRWPTKKSLTLLILLWTLAILLFALLYIGYDNLDERLTCTLGVDHEPITFAGAFAFSLETCTTVGYGLPNGVNSYFERGCTGLQILIYLQMVWSMIFNAFLITFLYSRVGRSETRSTQVIFSNKALVSMVRGQVRFQIRIFDCDAKHPVVEAHVRFYCVMKHRPVPRPLRLLQPDDDLGGMLFLSFPTVVNHNIDVYSLLHPPSSTMAVRPRGLVLRQVDGATSSRDDIICPICGESYGTFERWSNHVRYQQIVEAKDDYPVAGTHLSLDMTDFEVHPGSHATTDLQELKEYFKENVSEIICLVEGIDPMQSGTFTALQSYRYEDIVWEPYSQFAPCLTIVNANKKSKYYHYAASESMNNDGEWIYTVDLERYHDIVHDPHAQADAMEAQMIDKSIMNFSAASSKRLMTPINSPRPHDLLRKENGEKKNGMDESESSASTTQSTIPASALGTAASAAEEAIAQNHHQSDDEGVELIPELIPPPANTNKTTAAATTTTGTTTRKRYVRVKTASNRGSDCLFLPQNNNETTTTMTKSAEQEHPQERPLVYDDDLELNA